MAAGLLAALILAGCAAPAPRAPSPPPTPTRATPGPPPTFASPAPTPTSSATAEPTPSAPRPTHTPSPAPEPSPRPTSTPAGPSLAQLVGQKLVVRLEDTTPSAGLLARARAGEIGGVILFGANVTSRAQVEALTARLQAAAAAGGQPPLLIATDQEGGAIKRIPWAAPTLSPPQMGAIGVASTARQQGVATGEALLALGIDCDLAPVADVPTSADSFMYKQGRTWSFDSTVSATLSSAFARGLEMSGEVPAMKHFPGIGMATQNTDSAVVTIPASLADLTPGLGPFVAAIGRGLPMIMLSNATYPALDPLNGAGWSRTIVKGLLREQLGFRGVTITDSLSGTARARGIPVASLAIRAAIAGTDMILVTGSEASTQATYETLLAAARAGQIQRARLQASYDRIVALKAAI